jgi:hypothetical protein
MIIVALKAPLVDVLFREPDTVCVVPEVIAEPLPFAAVVKTPSDAAPWALLLTLLLLTLLLIGPLDPLFPLLGGGAADADPSTLMESLQERTGLGGGVQLTGKNPD